MFDTSPFLGPFRCFIKLHFTTKEFSLPLCLCFFMLVVFKIALLIKSSRVMLCHVCHVMFIRIWVRPIRTRSECYHWNRCQRCLFTQRVYHHLPCKTSKKSPPTSTWIANKFQTFWGMTLVSYFAWCKEWHHSNANIHTKYSGCRKQIKQSGILDISAIFKTTKRGHVLRKRGCIVSLNSSSYNHKTAWCVKPQKSRQHWVFTQSKMATSLI